MRSLHRHHVDRFLARAIPSTPGLRGLHVGCGRGERGAYRPPADQRWTNVDLVAGGQLQADIHRLPFRPGSFDLVRATEMMYFSDAPRWALGELRRVLKPGGRLVLTVPLLFPPIAPGDVMRLTPEGWRRILTFERVEIIQLGGYWTHLVTTFEHLSPWFCFCRVLAYFDRDTSYAQALGIIAE